MRDHAGCDGLVSKFTESNFGHPCHYLQTLRLKLMISGLGTSRRVENWIENNACPIYIEVEYVYSSRGREEDGLTY